MVTKVRNIVLELENPAIDGINMGGNLISNHGTPSSGTDVANKTYVDNVASGGSPGTFLEVAGDSMEGTLDMAGNSLIGLPAPVSSGDAARKSYVDTFLPLGGGIMSSALDMGFNRINNITDPAGSQDAATKNYVDAQIAGVGSGGGPTFISKVTVGGASGTFDCTPHVPPNTTVVVVEAVIGGVQPGNVRVWETGVPSDIYTVATGQGQNVGGTPDPGAGQIMCPISLGLTFDFSKAGSPLPALRLIGYF